MKYVALCRGINVGGNNKVPMADLKECFEKLGFTNVLTYINSGNVIFDTNQKSEQSLAVTIEKNISSRFGFPVKVLVRSRDNIQKVANAIPEDWQNDGTQKSDVLFLWEDYADPKSMALIQSNEGIDTLKYIEGAILWNVDREHYGKSGMNKFVGSELYKHMTARNVNTVRKLASLMR